MQWFAYRLVDFYNSCKNLLLLSINGEGGNSKIFTIYALSQLIGGLKI